MSSKSTPKGNLQWWQLALLGLGFTTGTGFFLGSGLAIEKSGYAVVLLFLIAAIGTYLVFSALADMIAQKAEEGSFRTYSKKAFGHWAGFTHGWIYWTSEILILGSQLTGLGVFTTFWFPNIPLWLLAAGYAVLGVLIVLLGTKGFEETENILAVVKISAILMFIIMAFLVFPGILGRENAHMHAPGGMGEFFTHGTMGLWTGLIYVFFAFAGIEVMGIVATQLKNPKDAPKSGNAMIPILTILFVLSISLALLLAPPDAFNAEESPFITALKDLEFNIILQIFNGILIIAGFSSLVASLYSVTQMVYTIAKDGDAPKFLTKQNKKKIPYHALWVTIGGMIVSIVVALLLPKKVYEYITVAGGLMLIYTWLIILFASVKLLKKSLWVYTRAIVAGILIILAATGTLFDESSRPGFYASFGFLTVILLVMLFMRKHWKHEHKGGGGGPGGGSPSAAEHEEEPPLFTPQKVSERLGLRSKGRIR